MDFDNKFVYDKSWEEKKIRKYMDEGEEQMIYDNIDFHNVAELSEVEGKKGLRIQRVPEETRKHLSENN